MPTGFLWVGADAFLLSTPPVNNPAYAELAAITGTGTVEELRSVRTRLADRDHLRVVAAAAAAACRHLARDRVLCHLVVPVLAMHTGYPVLLMFRCAGFAPPSSLRAVPLA